MASTIMMTIMTTTSDEEDDDDDNLDDDGNEIFSLACYLLIVVYFLPRKASNVDESYTESDCVRIILLHIGANSVVKLEQWEDFLWLRPRFGRQ